MKFSAISALLALSLLLVGCFSDTDKLTSPKPADTPTPVVLNQPTPTQDSFGFVRHDIENLKLEFFSPPDWLVAYDSLANSNFVQLSYNQNLVQIFYNQNLTYNLTDEQKARASQTRNSIVSIDNRQISANEIELDGGGLILTVNLPALGRKPPLTVWFTTNDRAQYRQNFIHLLETIKLH